MSLIKHQVAFIHLPPSGIQLPFFLLGSLRIYFAGYPCDLSLISEPLSTGCEHPHKLWLAMQMWQCRTKRPFLSLLGWNFLRLAGGFGPVHRFRH